jgi:hypothetical protein
MVLTGSNSLGDSGLSNLSVGELHGGLKVVPFLLCEGINAKMKMSKYALYQDVKTCTVARKNLLLQFAISIPQ